MNWLQLVGDWIAYVWPFDRVPPWERGVYILFSRWMWDIGPGVKFRPPWITEVLTAPTVPAILGTPRQDVTLRDGSVLSFQATATVRVVNARKALTEVDVYRETAQELLSSVLADELSQLEIKDLRPERGVRDRRLALIAGALNAEAAEFGVEFSKVRFTSCLTGAKTHRLLLDASQAAAW